MKTRYWTVPGNNHAGWREIGDGPVEFSTDDWKTVSESRFEKERHNIQVELVECTADGTPLSELPADRLTLAEFDAFAARVRANLALLEKEGER